jgi:hypothetical protein
MAATMAAEPPLISQRPSALAAISSAVLLPVGVRQDAEEDCHVELLQCGRLEAVELGEDH